MLCHCPTRICIALPAITTTIVPWSLLDSSLKAWTIKGLPGLQSTQGHHLHTHTHTQSDFKMNWWKSTSQIAPLTSHTMPLGSGGDKDPAYWPNPVPAGSIPRQGSLPSVLVSRCLFRALYSSNNILKVWFFQGRWKQAYLGGPLSVAAEFCTNVSADFCFQTRAINKCTSQKSGKFCFRGVYI